MSFANSDSSRGRRNRYFQESDHRYPQLSTGDSSGDHRPYGRGHRETFSSRDPLEQEPSRFRRGRGGRGRPFKRSSHPPHLQGKEIGLYYKNKKRMNRDKKNMPVLELPEERQVAIERLLDSLRSDPAEPLLAENLLFRDEYIDITTVPFLDKLDQCLEKGLRASIPSDLNVALRSELFNKINNPEFVKMLDFRKKLPAYQKRGEILKSIQENQVTVISGDTGCGKTTQVGQLILDEALVGGRGAQVRVMVTQPRRLAATSVAARVAAERAEPLGVSTGYTIRLDSAPPRIHASLEFVTAGVLLQRLQRDPALLGLSHLLLDEVHERDTTCDILLGILKLILPKRRDLKLVLMSATMDAERFCQYFGGCPLLHIPGVMFPIREFYLEDVIEMTGFAEWKAPAPVGPPWKRGERARRHEAEKAHLQHEHLVAPLLQRLRSAGGYSARTLASLQLPESETLCAELVVALVRELCRSRPPGAVLVFLPGMADISKVCRLLGDPALLLPPHLLLPLHSQLNALDQNAIFTPPPEGVRKIIVSTNIAETSITIDDVVYVIDCGRMKIGDYDVDSDVKTLQAEWVSKANAHQRRGRAGRVRPGECYRLYSSARAAVLAPRPPPELLRAPVHEPLLAAALLRLRPAFLGSLLDAPQPAAVATAVALLRRLGVLDAAEGLTPLGVHVARLPVAPGAARMLLLAALFSAAGPASSIAAVVAFRDPFVLPIGKEREVEAARLSLADGSGSDQLAAAEAQRRWARMPRREAEHFCRQNFLSARTLAMLGAMREQFGQALYSAGFLTSSDPDSPASNRHAANVALLKALVVAGLYPNVAQYYGHSRLSTPEDGRVQLHPSSVNARALPPAPHLVYRLKQRSSDLFLHDTSPADAMPLIFFGDNFCISEIDSKKEDKEDMCSVSSGGYAWHTTQRAAQLLERLRDALHGLLQQHLENPRPVRWEVDSAQTRLLQAIIELVTAEQSPTETATENNA